METADYSQVLSQFGALLAVVVVAAEALRDWFGEEGLYLLSRVGRRGAGKPGIDPNNCLRAAGDGSGYRSHRPGVSRFPRWKRVMSPPATTRQHTPPRQSGSSAARSPGRA